MDTRLYKIVGLNFSDAFLLCNRFDTNVENNFMILEPTHSSLEILAKEFNINRKEIITDLKLNLQKFQTHTHTLT